MELIGKKILNILDIMVLILNEIAEGKKIDNEFERERLRVWKSDKKYRIMLDDEWPEGFFDERIKEL